MDLESTAGSVISQLGAEGKPQQEDNSKNNIEEQPFLFFSLEKGRVSHITIKPYPFHDRCEQQKSFP